MTCSECGKPIPDCEWFTYRRCEDHYADYAARTTQPREYLSTETRRAIGILQVEIPNFGKFHPRGAE